MQFEPEPFKRLEQALARGSFRDDGGWATPILSEFSISTLRVWTDESQPVSARLKRLLLQLALLTQYVDSMQHVEPLGLALHETRNTLGLMCSLVRESAAQELSSDLRNAIRTAIAPWQGARHDLVKTLDRDYPSMLQLLRLPEWHRPDLMLVGYRYDPAATKERFDRCFREIRLMAQGKTDLPEPPCRRDDHSLSWLCNAIGKYLAEGPAVGLWTEVKTGKRLSKEIRQAANALADILD